MRYSNASFISNENSTIKVDIYGVTSFVPCDSSNIDYARIRKLVEDGELIIQPYAEAALR